MKKLYILFFLTIGFLANAQIINFPDANLKAKLLSANSSNSIAQDLLGNYIRIDTNLDGNIQLSEALNVSYLDISFSNIYSLEGIQNFLNLIFFDCSNNQLTMFNAQGLTNLQYLYCFDNQITSLNVQGLTNLTSLLCGFNRLTSLNIQGLTNLSILDCGYNQLTSLNAGGLANINQLNCQFNQLVSLNVQELTSLDLLDFNNNLISSVNLDGLTNLNSLICNNNLLSAINVQGLNNLRIFNCSFNQIISLNFNGLSIIESLICNNNRLTVLELSELRNLQLLNCNNNQLTSLFIKNGSLENYGLEFRVNPNLSYICCDESQIVNIQNLVSTNGQTCQINTYCSFTPGGNFYEITGKIKFDYNSNGCSISDLDFKNLKFTITNGSNTGLMIANQTGNYNIPVIQGIHLITPNLENSNYFMISPTSQSVNFPSQSSPFLRDFCVTANGVKSDLEVVVIPTTPARPGFDATYKLVYRNKGNQVENGTVSLTFDDTRLDYVAANPVYDSSATNSFTWNYVNLQPFETREIGIVFNVNSPMETPAVNNGDVLNYTATIVTTNTDETPTDNTFTLDQTVVGSYDPNDKTCLEGTTITPSEVGKYVHYVIRFENTGTFPAENIVVKDMIDLAKFDITTLVPLKSSHDFFTRISGNKVEFIFENINLDFNDATNDGYVVFKIKTKPTLVLGNTFTNNANIYFDYNFPITTNTYTTTVAALSSQDFDFGTYFTLYPNPAKEVLNIQTKQDVAINSIEIYNQLGQIVMATTNVVNTVDVANLATGTYFVKVNTEKGSANAKFVKE